MDALIENTKLRTYKALKTKKSTLSDHTFRISKSDDIVCISKILKLAKYNEIVINNLRIIICSDIKLQEYVFYIASIKLHHNILARAIISYIKDYMVDNDLDYRYLFIVSENYEKSANMDHYKKDVSIINKQYIMNEIVPKLNNIIVIDNDINESTDSLVDIAFLKSKSESNLILKSDNSIINNKIKYSNSILKSDNSFTKCIKKMVLLSGSILKTSS